jgi:nickel/cobalt exporter
VRRLAVLVAVFLAVTALGAVAAPAASAHPLGNFTVNQYSGLVVRPDGLRVDYVLDLAELPTFQYRPEIDADHDGTASPAELTAWSRRTCGMVAAGVRASADGRALTASVGRATGEFRPGTAGLPTLRVQCGFAVPGALDGVRRVEYRSGALTDRVGWREVTAVGDRMTVRGDVPRDTVSHRLTAYPADLLSSPPDVRAATLDLTAGGPALRAAGTADAPASASARGVDALTRAFTDFVGRPRLGVGVGVLAVLLSVLLGAAHAFAPGHGKTVMAAYLIGGRGRFRQAATVAGTVTVTHTAGVLVLGAVLTTAVALAPTRLYAWLGVTSGLLLATLGATMVGRVVRGRGALAGLQGHSHPHPHPHGDTHPHPHPHPHPHGDTHPHPHPHGDTHPHSHSHGRSRGPGGAEHAHSTAPPIRRAGLLAMGFIGGLVPSPSAVVVLLGAVALGRTWFGIVLVVGYGLGMAITLAGLGYLLARFGSALQRRGSGSATVWLRRSLPLVTASLILVVGLGIAAQAGIVLATSS